MTIRNVPDDARDVHATRAEREGRSLQEHLLSLIVESASRPTVAEVLARVRAEVRAADATVSVPAEEVVRLIREDRDSR